MKLLAYHLIACGILLCSPVVAFHPILRDRPGPSLTLLRASGDGLFGFLKSSSNAVAEDETNVEVTTRLSMQESKQTADDARFGFGARIESIKCVVVGALAGGVALAPAALIKDCILSGQSVAQWEFDTDTGSLEAALFAIVYRYCIREDTNPQLKDGVVGAFVLTRMLTRIQIPAYCSAVPLNCGSPTGYLDWYLLWQLAVNGAESGILFFAVASAMEYCFEKGYISKFPG